MHSELDVFVIGGGPAGTTVATLLARRNRKVAIFEKDHHPRFHIGESLLPMNLPILERLGVLAEVERIGVKKNGAEFIDGANPQRSQIYYFSEAAGNSPPHAFQVKREEFDHLLWRNCEASGAMTFEGWRVRNVEKVESGWRLEAVDDKGEKKHFKASYLVDTSGRHTVLARQFSSKQKNPAHATAALFGHFTGVIRGQGEREGNISIYWFEQGWFWMIPLQNGLMSVGAVCHPDYLSRRKNTPREFLFQTVKMAPAVSTRMAAAQLVGEVRATGNYSYQSTLSYTERCLLVGDALAFVDPVFSSGVFLAMSSAETAAQVIDRAIDNPETFAAGARDYTKKTRAAIRCFSWFIIRFNTPAMKKLFLTENPPPAIKANVTSLLAGDVHGQTPIYGSLRLFKLIYYCASLPTLAGSFKNYWQRKKNVRTWFSGETTLKDNS